MDGLTPVEGARLDVVLHSLVFQRRDCAETRISLYGSLQTKTNNFEIPSKFRIFPPSLVYKEA